MRILTNEEAAVNTARNVIRLLGGDRRPRIEPTFEFPRGTALPIPPEGWRLWGTQGPWNAEGA